MKQNSKILISGGAGFIGSHTVNYFLQQGLVVTVVDNLTTGNINNLNLQHQNLQFVEGDICDKLLMSDLINDCDVILHLAAIASVPLTIQDPVTSLEINSKGFVNLLQLVRMSKSRPRLVYASSAAVYGHDAQLPCKEDQFDASNLQSPYAMQKLCNEMYANWFQKQFALQTLGLRYFNVYGSQQRADSVYSGVISKFVDCFDNDKTLALYGDGQQTRDFIAVNDVAKANYLACLSGHCGILNIATGQQVTLVKLIQTLEELYKKKLPINYMPERVGDIRHSYAEITQAKHHLDYFAEYRLIDGLRELIGQA